MCLWFFGFEANTILMSGGERHRARQAFFLSLVQTLMFPFKRTMQSQHSPTLPYSLKAT